MAMSSNPFPNNPFENPFAGFKRPKLTPGKLTLITLAVIVALFVAFSGFYADLLWFKSVDFQSVWSKMLFTKIDHF
jgi:hypothetical protein